MDCFKYLKGVILSFKTALQINPCTTLNSLVISALITANLNIKHAHLTKKEEEKKVLLRCMHDVSSQNVKWLPDVSMPPCMMYQQQN